MKTGWQFKTTGYMKYRSKKKKGGNRKKRNEEETKEKGSKGCPKLLLHLLAERNQRPHHKSSDVLR